MESFLFCCIASLAGEPAAEPAHDRVVLEIESRTPELEAALKRAGVAALDPVFRAPAHGWRDEAAASAAGLHRFFRARFATPRDDVATVAAALAQQPGVRSCRPACTGVVGGVPDDPEWLNQWSLMETYTNGPDAWDIATATDRVLAVLDSGADLGHPQLSPNLWTNSGEIAGNGIDDDGNGYVDDVHGYDIRKGDGNPDDLVGHGTHVAGVAGAAGNDGSESAGVCWSIPLMIVKVWGAAGPLIVVDDCAEGVTYAADNGAAALQMAWGFVTEEPVLRAAFDYAVALDVLPVGIAGNDGNDIPLYPAAWDDVIGVIATDKSDFKARWCSWGVWNDIAAPGDKIWLISRRSEARIGSGTSYASPHVSAGACLIQAINPDLDAVATRLVLQQSAKDVDPPGFDDQTGWGRLDLAAAARLAQTLHAAPTVAAPGGVVTLTLDVPSQPSSLYGLFVTRFERRPGIPLSEYEAGDVRQFPLNDDALLFELITGALPGGEALFDRFIECTDEFGHSTATLKLPRGSFFTGDNLDFCALLFDPADVAHVATMSCTARVAVR